MKIAPVSTSSTLMAQDLLSSRYTSDAVLLRFRRDGLGQPEQRTAIELTTPDIQDLRLRLDVNLREELKKVSQVGLKELWLGEQPGGGAEGEGHDRWGHSKGAMNVGVIWLKVLQADNRVPEHCLSFPADGWSKAKALVATALLLHDYGHLPFSHLLNEVLESINWVPRYARAAGLEGAVLRDRLTGTPFLQAFWPHLLNEHEIGYRKQGSATSEQARDLVRTLILGGYGTPWMQAIVNSPVDADKIDYIGYDTQFLARTDYPVRPRIEERIPTQWLTEFLYDQEVNHAGILCLHGRSAVAAADLWRERVFLYDRFYLAPDLRVAERIAFEIVQGFLIHATMSRTFLQNIQDVAGEGLSGLPERFDVASGTRGQDGLDPIQVKYETVMEIMLALLPKIETGDREFTILRTMYELLKGSRSIDVGYIDFVSKCFSCLEKLSKKELRYRDLVADSLVREPIVFHRRDFSRVKELLRPLQHTYCRDVLIDAVRLPRVLAPAHRWKGSFEKTAEPRLDHSIMVPVGRASKWTPNSRAVCPLTDESVEDLELSYGRILVIAPHGSRFTRTEYIWDRVRASLLEEGIELLEAGREAL